MSLGCYNSDDYKTLQLAYCFNLYTIRLSYPPLFFPWHAAGLAAAARRCLFFLVYRETN